MLHLIQSVTGGDQITSLMIGGFGGLILMLNFFNNTKSLIEELEVFVVLLPAYDLL